MNDFVMHACNQATDVPYACIDAESLHMCSYVSTAYVGRD